MKKKLLFISHRVPYPPDKGERLRAYHELRALSESFEVTLATTAADAGEARAAEALEDCCERLIVLRRGRAGSLAAAAGAMLSGRSASEGFFKARALGRAVKRAARCSGGWDVAVGYCSSMLEPLLAAPATGRVMDLVDVDSAKWSACSRRGVGVKKIIHAVEARRVARLEARALSECDAVAVTSTIEAALLPGGGQSGEGEVHVMGNGVDAETFAHHPPSSEPVVVFTGTMSYEPNIDAVAWLAEAVWPRVRAARPSARLSIVGREPSPKVRSLDGRDGIEVTGAVDDVRPYLRRAAVAVAPLRIARGIQNKVLEAMAAGPAVLASPPALEGLEVEPGRDVLAAASAETFARELVRLLGDEALRTSLSRRARRVVEERYSWSARLAPLVDLCRRLTAGAEGRR